MKTYTFFFSVLIVCVLSAFSSTSYAVKHTVLVGSFYFNPSNIPNVQVGDTIRWQWVEGMHTTTSTTIPAGAATWDAPMTSTNQVFEYKVTVAGTYNYKCTPHASIQLGSFTAAGAPAPTLTVTPSNRNVEADAGSTTFTVSSNSSWTTSSDKTWCMISPASGTGNGTITASYNENTSTDVRVATITIVVTGLSPQMVTVTQSGSALVLTITPEVQEVTAASGSTEFDVMTNTNWVATSNESWCTVTPSGSGNGILTATFTANTSADEREATITVIGNGSVDTEVKVKQDGSGLGIDNKAAKTIAVYPNPTSGPLTIVLLEGSGAHMEVCILDITGKSMKTEYFSGSKSFHLDISDLPEGIYFIRIKEGETVSTNRIIKIK